MTNILYRQYYISNNSRYKDGYYRFSYNIGNRDDDVCEYSKHGYSWEKCDLFKSLGEFEDELSKISEIKYERLEYIHTITYRGYSINIFMDDYGLCFFTFFDGKELSFGGWQSDIEDDIKYLIDSHISKNVK